MGCQKIYIVWGSEDGPLGTYSTIKRAYVRATNYTEKKSKSYNTVCKDIGDYNRADLEAESDGCFRTTTATIYKTILNE